ncbi:hypothetical protein EI555_000203, partial [Monodon monoceros]
LKHRMAATQGAKEDPGKVLLGKGLDYSYNTDKFCMTTLVPLASVSFQFNDKKHKGIRKPYPIGTAFLMATSDNLLSHRASVECCVTGASQPPAKGIGFDNHTRLGKMPFRIIQYRLPPNVQSLVQGLVSVGTVELLPLSAFLCPSEPGGAVGGRGCAADGQDPPRGGGPLGGAPQHSLHLSALVQLVKEIPEFLFGEVSPESGGASLDGEGASPEAAAVMADTCPLRGLLGCLPDTPVGRPGLAAMPSGSSSRSPPRARGQGSPLPIRSGAGAREAFLSLLQQKLLTCQGLWRRKAQEPPARSLALLPVAPAGGRATGIRREGPRVQGCPEHAGLAGAAGTSPGNSPLQGLINCLKEILEPGPQHPERPLRLLPPARSLGASQLTGAELRPGSPPWAVKTETASGACPLQSLLNCLKEIPEARDKQPSPSGARDPWLQEDPGAWKRNSGGPRPLQTPPPGPGPGAGSVLPAVKVEDGWAQGPPEPTSCQLSKRTHGPSAAGSPGDNGGTAWVQVPSWGSAARGSQGTSTSFSSSSSIDGDLDFQSPEGSQGHRPGKGPSSDQPRLRALGFHRKPRGKLPAPGPGELPQRDACTWAAAHLTLLLGRAQGAMEGGAQELDGGHGRILRLLEGSPAAFQSSWRPAPGTALGAASPEAGLRGETCEPAHLGQRGGDVPPRSLRLASPQALASGTIPACDQQGPKDPGAARPGPWRWLPDGPATKPSPLHCLENSLKGILPGGPLRFTCLADPVPGPSPSPSSSSSSSEGEDPRLEPELWQPLLQGTAFPAARALALLPHALAALVLAAALVKAGEEARPGTTVVSVQVSLGSPEKGEKQKRRWEAGPIRPGEKCAWRAWARLAPWAAPEEVVSKYPRSEWLWENDVYPHPKCSVLFLRGQLWIPALPLSWRKGRGLGPASLLGQPVGPRPGIRQLVKGPGAWGTETEAQVLQPGPTRGPFPEIRLGLPPEPPSLGLCRAPPRGHRAPAGHELRGLGAALSEKLDRLAGTLAGLAQEVAAVRTQVDRLGRRPWGPGTKGLLWGPRWTGGPAHRHPPYWKHKGPRRPRPKVLRGQAEGCRAGDSSGLAGGRPRLVPQLPPDVPLAEASGPSSGPLSSACGSPAVLTTCHPLELPESYWSPPPPLLPAAPPLQVAASAGAEPRAAAAAPPRTLKWPKDPSSLLAGLQRALEGELWGGEHRDPGWGPPSRRLNGLHPSEDAPPLASSGGRPPPSAPCSRTFPVSGL